MESKSIVIRQGVGSDLSSSFCMTGSSHPSLHASVSTYHHRCISFHVRIFILSMIPFQPKKTSSVDSSCSSNHLTGTVSTETRKQRLGVGSLHHSFFLRFFNSSRSTICLLTIIIIIIRLLLPCSHVPLALVLSEMTNVASLMDQQSCH